MFRIVRVAGLVTVLASCLIGCGSAAGPEAAAVNPAEWLGGVKPWYCGVEALPPMLGKDGVSVPRSRTIAMKIVPLPESFTAVYSTANGNDKSVGSFTRFVGGAARTATLNWQNEQRQKGDALIVFSPDYKTAALTWTLTSDRPGGSSVPSAPTTLTAATADAECVKSGLLR